MLKELGYLARPLAIVMLVLQIGSAVAAEVRVAVASNFYPTAKKLVSDFESETGHQVSLSSGSTGKHYAQIKQGAPFDLFLAADQQRPERLLKEGIGIQGSLKTYAIGKLVLWSSITESRKATIDLLKDGGGHIAMANSMLAPYGRAAEETLQKLNLLPAVSGRLVIGENVSQAYQFIVSGNAEVGFVAGSQIAITNPALRDGVWELPQELHQPIVQQMLLISENNQAAELHAYISSTAAMDIIRASGYRVP